MLRYVEIETPFISKYTHPPQSFAPNYEKENIWHNTRASGFETVRIRDILKNWNQRIMLCFGSLNELQNDTKMI